MSWFNQFDPETIRSQDYEGNFGGQSWDYWTKEYNYYTPGKEGQRKQNTLPSGLVGLKQDDPQLYERLNTSVFRWGQMPVEYSMNELGFDELDFDDEDQLEELNNYLEENFPDIFQQGDAVEEEEERDPFEVTTWEPKELDVGDYTPTPTKELQTSKLKIGSSPMPVSQLTIKGTSGFKK